MRRDGRSLYFCNVDFAARQSTEANDRVLAATPKMALDVWGEPGGQWRDKI